MLQKVEGHSTFLATSNATIAVTKWGVTREFFLTTCNATFVALQVARKIASCYMALRACYELGVSRSITVPLLKNGHCTSYILGTLANYANHSEMKSTSVKYNVNLVCHKSTNT